MLVTLGWSLDSPSPLAALQHLLVALSEHCGKDFSIIGNHALLCVELASWEPKSRPSPPQPQIPSQRKHCSLRAMCLTVVQYPAVVIAAAGLLASWTLSNADVPSSIGMHVLCELCRISRVDLVRCAKSCKRPVKVALRFDYELRLCINPRQVRGTHDRPREAFQLPQEQPVRERSDLCRTAVTASCRASPVHADLPRPT